MPKTDIEVLSPPGTFKPTGPWSPGVRAGDFVFVAGMRGIDPSTNMPVEGDEARVRQAFTNMKTIVEAAGGTLRDTVRLAVYVTDMNRHRPLVNRIGNGGTDPWITRDGPSSASTRRAIAGAGSTKATGHGAEAANMSVSSGKWVQASTI